MRETRAGIQTDEMSGTDRWKHSAGRSTNNPSADAIQHQLTLASIGRNNSSPVIPVQGDQFVVCRCSRLR